MKGLGDSIYQRPFVRALTQRREVYLQTPWPELYADLDVRFVRTRTELRTQAINEARNRARYVEPPIEATRAGFGYAGSLAGSNIAACMERRVPLGAEPFVFDLPDMGPAPFRADDRPYAVVRPVTIRSEWRNEARNPDPRYVAEIAAELRKTHAVVLVAHLAERQEWLAGELPPHDLAFITGELNVREMLALVREADVVVGGVGWIVPATIALRRPAFVILGGQGGHNAPARITDPRMDLSRLGWARPDQFCRCENMSHRCPKEISDLPNQWAAFRAGMSS